MEARGRLGQWPKFHESAGIMPADSTRGSMNHPGSAQAQLANEIGGVINEWR
jgi:hypothetical protein